MRTILLSLGLLAAALAIDARPADAQAYYYPWCHQQGGRDGVLVCSYVSFQQCAINIPGDGGYCLQNPWYQGGAVGEPYRRARRPG